MKINCLVLQEGEINGLPPEIPLEELEGEEIMVCDMDAIGKGKFNFKLYGEISKFLEPVVVNFPTRVEDMMDTLIAGASRVVLASDVTESILGRMLAISDGVVLPSDSPQKPYFIENGGRFLISEREVFTPFDLCYNVGPDLTSEKYINVKGFPESLLHYI